MIVGFQPVNFSCSKLLNCCCVGCISPLCSLVLFFAFKYVVHCVLFLPEKVRPMLQTKRRVASFSLKNILRLLLYLLKFNLSLIVPEEPINFKLSIIPGNSVYIKNMILLTRRKATEALYIGKQLPRPASRVPKYFCPLKIFYLFFF